MLVAAAVDVRGPSHGAGIMEYIEQQALLYPDMADKYAKLGDLYSRK